jgi:hypothetical protein
VLEANEAARVIPVIDDEDADLFRQGLGGFDCWKVDLEFLSQFFIGDQPNGGQSAVAFQNDVAITQNDQWLEVDVPG